MTRNPRVRTITKKWVIIGDGFDQALEFIENSANAEIKELRQWLVRPPTEPPKLQHQADETDERFQFKPKKFNPVRPRVYTNVPEPMLPTINLP